MMVFRLLLAGLAVFPAIAVAEIAPAGDTTERPLAAQVEPSGPVKSADPSSLPDDSSIVEKLLESPHASILTDEHVAAQMEYFTTAGREIFQNWLDRSSRYLPLMKKIFRQHRLPEDLVYIAMIESGLRMDAVSRSQAVGPWQFMSATARTYGLKIDGWIDERRDPVKSTKAAAAYLHDLHARFGSWHLALASYNAGAGRITRALFLSQENGLPSLYESQVLRRETRNYVPRLLAAVLIARDPEHYGFTSATGRAFRYDEVQIAESTDIDDIAAMIGCSVEAISQLNPELETGVTPQYVNHYVLRLPAGTKSRYEAAKQLFRGRISLITPRFDAAYDPLTGGRPHEYAVLRKMDSMRSIRRARRRVFSQNGGEEPSTVVREEGAADVAASG